MCIRSSQNDFGPKKAFWVRYLDGRKNGQGLQETTNNTFHSFSLNKTGLLGIEPCLRISLGIVSVSTAVLKIQSIAQLQDSIVSMRLFPRDMTGAISYGVILFELIVGTALLVPRLTNTAYRLLVIWFSLLIAYNLVRGFFDIAVPCACFGALLKSSPIASYIAALVLCGLSIMGKVAHGLKTKP